MAMIEAIGIPDTKLCKERLRPCEADVLNDKDPPLVRENFCSVIRGSRWNG
jgi:hypothetical protein